MPYLLQAHYSDMSNLSAMLIYCHYYKSHWPGIIVLYKDQMAVKHTIQIPRSLREISTGEWAIYVLHIYKQMDKCGIDFL